MANKVQTVETRCIGALRSLVIDMTNKAKSGHPGMALDVAPAFYALFHDHLNADPLHPEWLNRDRFVLSAGHVSSLYYAMLHLCGYDLSLEDLKSFRQLGSRTPGHPERGVTPGIDATSGPLGQGIAQAVGMAMAEKHIRFAYPDAGDAFGHYTYCLCGDGCLEEGIGQEAISLAGLHRLNKLILIYDANGSTLDGPTSDSLVENVKLRFLSCEWNVLEIKDGNDVHAISKAIGKAKKSSTYPTLILIHSIIGYGAPNQGSHKTHGSPLGEEAGNKAKEVYGVDYPPFDIPAEVYAEFASSFATRGKDAYASYEEALAAFQKKNPEQAKQFLDGFAGNFESYRPAYPDFDPEKPIATRVASGKCLQAVHDVLPFTFGGSADVGSSTNTHLKNEPIFSPETPYGRDVRWGIREFAMASCCNGIALHGGLAPYCSSFLVFADYLKPAVRMAAIQKLPVVYIFTHDTIAVGEDGPTHQPIEQVAMLRGIPGVEVFRPADATEVKAAYDIAFYERKGPVALILSRQGLPVLPEADAEKAKKGGYLVYAPKNPKLQILATGSEVSLALEVAKKLQEEHKIPVAVASLPSLSRFLSEGEEYRASVLVLPREKRLSLEAGLTYGWGDLAAHHYGIDTFGASGPAKDVLSSFGFDVPSISETILNLIKEN